MRVMSFAYHTHTLMTQVIVVIVCLRVCILTNCITCKQAGKEITCTAY